MKAAQPPAPKPGAQAAPAPTPQPTQQAQAPPAPQSGEQPQQKPQTQPLAPQQSATLESPAPAPKPNFRTGGSVREQIQSAANAAAQGGPGGGDYGAGAPSRHPGNVGGFDVLSDTMGVDFGPYLARLKFLIEHSWWPLIPGCA